jgi:hypothetical protein
VRGYVELWWERRLEKADLKEFHKKFYKRGYLFSPDAVLSEPESLKGLSSWNPAIGLCRKQQRLHFGKENRDTSFFEQRGVFSNMVRDPFLFEWAKQGSTLFS